MFYNGSTLLNKSIFFDSRYTKTVAGIGVSAQKYNPEMKPPTVRDVVIKTMADKLQHVKQVCNHLKDFVALLRNFVPFSIYIFLQTCHKIYTIMVTIQMKICVILLSAIISYL